MPSYLTPQMLNNYRHPRNMAEINKWTSFGQANNDLCGDEVNIYLNVVDNVIQDASFTGSGCILTVVSADRLIESIKNQNISRIHPDITNWSKTFDNIPKARENCIAIAVLALKQALARQ